jgi:hypothetical protein
VANRECSISLATLRAAPYNLVKDDQVKAKIISVNIYGDSAISEEGSGAVIQYVPDAPVNLTNDPTTTSDTVIKFTWDDGSSNGGTPVIDYIVSYDQGTDNLIVLETGVLT